MKFFVLFITLSILLSLSLDVIAKNPELEFQQDRKIKSVSNLRYVESTSSYLTRKVEELEEEVKKLKEQIQKLRDHDQEKTNDETGIAEIWPRLLAVEEKIDDFDLKWEGLDVLDERIDETEKILASDRFVLSIDLETKLKKEKKVVAPKKQALPMAKETPADPADKDINISE